MMERIIHKWEIVDGQERLRVPGGYIYRFEAKLVSDGGMQHVYVPDVPYIAEVLCRMMKNYRIGC